ncbi:4Fe-4S ferredoxin [Archaeoglobales archaeon]|nr:MAG: 4Fe-4S ferredoxin [Archaeoglobales archaeon]
MITRRRFLIMAGSALTTITLTASQVEKVLAAFASPAIDQKKVKWGMVIDLKKFNELPEEKRRRVYEVCKEIHNIPVFPNPKDRVEWIWPADFEHTFPTQFSQFLPEEVEQLEVPVLCNHCENPPCTKVCPTGATWKRDDGIVTMDYHRCIGCRYCMAACPYGMRSFNWRDPRPFIKKINTSYHTRTKGVVEKCTFCVERLEKGLQPACVEASEGSFIFGDLNSLESEITKILKEHYSIRRKPDLGTEPKLYYLI